MLKAILLSLVALVLATEATEAKSLGGVTCPTTWTFDDQVLNLRWAEVWVGWESLAPIEGRTQDGRDWQEPERRRDYDEIFWDMENFKKPAFLHCIFGNGLALNKRTAAIVPIPDDSKTCHTAYRSTSKAGYITSISCSPGKAPVPPPSVVERLTPATELDGLMLRKSRAELEGRTRAHDATWERGSDDNTATVVIPANGNRYRVVFSSATGLAREIALIGKPWAGRSDFVVAIERRFGPYNLNPWKGEDGVWIDWDGGYRKDGPRQPEQMRLLDMNDPDNSKDATLLAR